MIRIVKQGALVALVLFLALPVVAGRHHEYKITIDQQSNKDKKSDDGVLVSTATSLYKNIVKPGVKGAIVGAIYFAGTEGFSVLAKNCGVQYEGFIKFLGTFASIAIGANLVTGGNSQPSNDGYSLLRAGVGAAAILTTAMGLHKAVN